nr:hypothetical protein [Alterinioella nitratireducens]
MTQSRHMSLTEMITNLAIGHKLAVVTQIIVFHGSDCTQSLAKTRR